MEKAILISINPEWCAEFINGNKKWELRKTCPTEWKAYFNGRKSKPAPMKGYIYCTKKEILMNVYLTDDPKQEVQYLQGKIIGEFILKDIDKFTAEFTKDNSYEEIVRYVRNENADYADEVWEEKIETTNEEDNPSACELCRKSYVPYARIKKYLGVNFHDKPLYAWHIDNLKIYYKPRELKEFRTASGCFNNRNITITKNVFDEYVGNYSENSFCKICKYYDSDWGDCEKTIKPITRPPQSWFYVIDWEDDNEHISV